GPVHGEVPFTVGLDTINMVATADRPDVRIVRQERLDDLIGGAEPIMMKVDVEGYEDRVLKGTSVVLSSRRLRAVELETVTPEVNQLMVDHGFQRVYYNPFDRGVYLTPLDIDVRASNVLFIRDREFVEERLMSARSIQVLGREI